MLFAFDLDGTLIEGFLDVDSRTGKLSPCHPYERVAVLPRRREILAQLVEAGQKIAVITNQGGVAFGSQTEAEVETKLNGALYACGLREAIVKVAYTHPSASVAEYRVDDGRRKPGSGMLLEALRDAGYVSPVEMVFVGDMETDRLAAEEFGCRYYDESEFFVERDGAPALPSEVVVDLLREDRV